MKEKFGNFLQYIGYIGATTSLPEFSVYFLPGNGSAEVIMTIDYQKEIYLTEDVYNGVQEKFVQSFKEKGFSTVHMLTVVLCKDLARMEAVFAKDSFCWYLDTENEKLVVPKEHVEDFYGLKRKVEDFLCSPKEYDIDKLGNEWDEVRAQKIKKPFKERSFINAAIIIVNVLIFIMCAFTGDLLYNKGAFSILFIQEAKEYYRFITAAFLHADIFHLLSNMIMLYFLGNMLERKIGHIKYVLLYLISAIGGKLLSAVYEMYIGDMFLSYGASGAIFGVTGAVLMLVIIEGGRWENITLPRMLIMVIYLLYSGFMAQNVNNAGHIGGFVTGFVVMALFCVINRLRKKKEVLHEN